MIFATYHRIREKGTSWAGTSPRIFLVSIFLLISCLPNVSKNVIMAQEQINCIQNTEENWWVLIRRTLCQIMEQLRPTTGNPLEIYFWFLYILYVFLMFQTSIIMAQEHINSLHTKNGDRWVLLWENVVSYHGSATA